MPDSEIREVEETGGLTSAGKRWLMICINIWSKTGRPKPPSPPQFHDMDFISSSISFGHYDPTFLQVKYQYQESSCV